MITIEPTIKIYDDEGNLSRAYDKAVDKMIDKIYDIDLEQFDFDEVANGKSKELDNLVVKLCKESGLGSKDIYTMLLDRFEVEYDVPVDFVVYLGKDWEDDFEESKKSARKSIKESSVRCVTFEQIVDSRFDDISKGEKILNDRKDEIIELCGDDFSVYTNKIEFLDWGDDESQYRQRYYIRKNNNKVTWNDLYKIVNSVKTVPYDFKKVNDTLFESRKSIKESKIMGYKDFQDVCMEESENDIINFHEYKGAYFVILRTEEECERLLRVLRDKYKFEGTCYKIIDPYNPNYKCYEIMCV